MNATKALRRVERQRQHRAKTGGLAPREHVAHEKPKADNRTKRTKRWEELIDAIATGKNRFEAADESVEKPKFTRGAKADHVIIDEAVQIAPCPKCGAVGDEPCRKPNGRKADAPHKVRVEQGWEIKS